MNKIIVISTLLSTLLLAMPTVNNLNVSQTNKAENTATTNSTVKQGDSDITGANTQVTDLTITQEATGNLIDQSTITDSTVYQGNTRVKNDAIITKVEIDSDSTINNNSKVLNGSEVRQSDTEIDNSTATNLKIKSTNSINNSKIDGGFTRVEQATLIITDSNASDSNAMNVDIESTNTIANTDILQDSESYQSYTEIANASTVNGLNLKQINSIDHTILDDESKAYQSNTIVDNSTVSNLTQTVTNSIDNTLVQDSNISFSGLEQAEIDIYNNSNVKDVTVKPTTQNSIKGLIAYDASVKQNGLYVDNSSIVQTLTIDENNNLQNTGLDTSDFIQGNININ